MSLLGRASRRHLLRHPGQLALQLLGIGVGIAVVVAVDLAIASSRAAFRDSVGGVVGRATHQIVAGTTGIDEELYRALRLEHGIRSIAPVVQREVRVVTEGRPVRTLLGVDVYAEASFRAPTARLAGGAASELVPTPGAAILESGAAAALGLSVGDRFEVQVGADRRPLELVATIDAPNELDRRRAAGVIVVDIATAQETLGCLGRLDRIDVRLDAPGAPTAEELAALLPASVELRPADLRRGAFEGMTGAFQLNLQALGLLALVVGMFLIHHTITVSVLGRRMLWGRLRALGVRRREIVRIVLGEALLVGTAGTAVGVLGGLLLGRGLVGVVRDTIEELYTVLGEDVFVLTPTTLAKAAALGIGTSLLSALPPALEASRADLRPVLRRSSLESAARRASLRRIGAAVACLVLAAGALAIPGGSLVLGYVALLGVLLAFAFVAPSITRLLVGVALAIGGRVWGLVGRMAVGGISTQLSRTGLAVAALAVAVSMTIGVTTMIGSFRSSLETWLGKTLPADVYLSAPGPVARQGIRAPLPPEVERACREHPDARLVIANRLLELPGPDGDVTVALLGAATPEELGIPLEDPVALEDWLRGTPPRVLISEPFARRHDLSVGDPLPLRTDAGPVTFEVLGVFQDYASDLGYVAVARPTFERYHAAPGSTSIAIHLRDGADPVAVADELGRRFADLPALTVAPTATLRASTLAIFDRTFRVTEVIRILAIMVAAIGVFGALQALQLERARELGVLRATGLTRRELAGVVIVQTGGIGLIAGLIAAPLGVVSAALLTRVVNGRSFGWTIDLTVEAGPLAEGVLLAVGAALLAGIAPAIAMARTPIHEALREMEA